MLERFSTASGFARLLDRSESLIRNVEAGTAKFSDYLADKIEEKTGVSAAWMLGPNARTGEILAVDGSPWNPAEFLDHYVKGGLLANIALVMKVHPELVPALVGKLVEARLMMEGPYEDEGYDRRLVKKVDPVRHAFDGKRVLLAVLKLIRVTKEQEKHRFADALDRVLYSEHDSDRLRTVWNFIAMDNVSPPAG